MKKEKKKEKKICVECREEVTDAPYTVIKDGVIEHRHQQCVPRELKEHFKKPKRSPDWGLVPV